MNFVFLPNESLEILHTAVRNALFKDESPMSESKGPMYGVRSNSDWPEWSNRLEVEMSKRDMTFDSIPW
jgi:hypothetical protein